MTTDTQTHVVVAADGTRLVSTDHGGEGRDLVLMHGLGMRRTSLGRLVEQLQRLAGWHVVTVDLRGHGDSAAGPWSFDLAVDDLARVVSHHGLGTPYVGGHSLGGMVALRYALAGHPVAGAVNIDGWGPGMAERFVGEDPAVVTEQLDRLATGRLPTRAARVISGATRQSREGTTRDVMQELRYADVVGWHRDAPVPSLALHAVAAPSRSMSWMLGGDTARLQSAHHAGLTRDLARVAEQRPDVTVVEVDATHGLFRTHAELVASAIDRFAQGVE